MAMVLAVLAVAAAAAVAGCGAGSRTGTRAHDRAPSTPSSTTPSVGAVSPQAAPVAWSPCQHGLQCGSLTVPLDYADPAGLQITLALARHPAEDPQTRLGSLVLNPGGPGGSGIDDLPAELAVMTPGLLERFDVVSFDPRGVDRSAPVSCGEPVATAAAGLLPDPAPASSAARQAAFANDKAYAVQCARASGLLLGFVGTIDAARDLDRIRAALGDAQLTYIGHSYGTLLGLTYAKLFPTRVRAMVLDGVNDPALPTTDMVVDQAVGFEQVLDDFFRWCTTSGSCTWRPAGDPLQALLSMADSVRAAPLPAGGGRQAGPGELYTAVLSSLYSPSGWGRLGAALAEAQRGNGAAIVSMSDAYDTENGPNSVDAENAVSCLDHPVPTDPSVYPQLAGAAAARAPFFGPMLIWGLLQCAVWPTPPDRTPAPVTATGAPPILLVASSGDPATPHAWASAVQGELAKSVLVTWQGVSHVAYYYSPCVRAIDQAYLLDGTLPANGTVCGD
jgi:pimeloyl-ACP methyl ester carboxylesterase